MPSDNHTATLDSTLLFSAVEGRGDDYYSFIEGDAYLVTMGSGSGGIINKMRGVMEFNSITLPTGTITAVKLHYYPTVNTYPTTLSFHSLPTLLDGASPDTMWAQFSTTLVYGITPTLNAWNTQDLGATAITELNENATWMTIGIIESGEGGNYGRIEIDSLESAHDPYLEIEYSTVTARRRKILVVM
jgi:hypothetical protein